MVSMVLLTRLLPNGRFEAASESKVKNAKQFIIYALAFLCFSQKLNGEIFDLFRFRVVRCFLNAGVIKSMNGCYFHVLLSNLVKCRSGQKARTTRFLTAVALSIDFGAHEGEGLSAMRIMNRAAPGGM
jgi:hypothetical protein